MLSNFPQQFFHLSTLRVMNMTGAMSLNNLESQANEQSSPPAILNGPIIHPRMTAASSFQPSTSVGTMAPDLQNQYYPSERDLNISINSHFDSTAPPELYTNNINSIARHQAIPIMTGAQSYSGVYHTGAMGQVVPIGDLGYALQRPGVDPCASLAGSQQVNHIYMHQAARMPVQPSSLGSLVQASSYNDPMDMSNHYTSIHPSAMSMPSMQHGSIPQDYTVHHPSSFHQMAYNEANFNHDPNHLARRDHNNQYYPYRGSSM